MGGHTGKRAKAPGTCHVCGKKIEAGANFMRDRRGDSHCACWQPVKREEPVAVLLFNVTRWCCASGLCLDCHQRRERGEVRQVPLEAARARVVQCLNLTKEKADAARQSWDVNGFAPKVEPVPGVKITPRN